MKNLLQYRKTSCKDTYNLLLFNLKVAQFMQFNANNM